MSLWRGVLRGDQPIAATSTPPGRGAIGVLRLSGSPEAVARIAGAVLGGRPLKPREALLRTLRHPQTGMVIDRGIALRFEAPRSYTGEEVLELHLHGAPVVLRLGLEALVAAGARLAEPGEFTRRAVTNGRLNLAQAEAVGALVQASSAAAVRLAQRHLGGELGERLGGWRAGLLAAAASLEALVDFPEDVPASELRAGVALLDDLEPAMEALATSYRAGRRAVQGARVVLRGPVNAGKSSLFNLLLGHDRAIVSAQPGTTRDLVAEHLEWEGLALRLEDTAGQRESSDLIELDGMQRSARAASAADLVLAVRDARTLAFTKDQHGRTEESSETLWIATHADHLNGKAQRRAALAGWLVVDARRGDPAPVRRAVLRALNTPAGSTDELLLHTERQRDAMERARAAVAEARSFGDAEPVLAAQALRRAGRALSELLGGWSDEAVLDELFARFCVGK